MIAVARRLRGLTATHGGFTVELPSATHAQRGYSVATAPEHSLVFAWPAWDDGDVAHWLQSAAHGSAGKPPHVGGWLDPRSGMVWLDLVTIVAPALRATACRLGRDFGQHCLWDLDRGEAVHLGANR